MTVRAGERTLASTRPRAAKAVRTTLDVQVQDAWEIGPRFGVTYALLRWKEVDKARFFTNVGIALAIAGTLVAYPLWVQFTGPGSYKGVPEFTTVFGNDLAAFVTFSPHSVGAALSPFNGIEPNPTEENAYFGLPLLARIARAADAGIDR